MTAMMQQQHHNQQSPIGGTVGGFNDLTGSGGVLKASHLDDMVEDYSLGSLMPTDAMYRNMLTG